MATASATTTTTTSRFHIIKINTGPYKRGRWTCIDKDDHEVTSTTSRATLGLDGTLAIDNKIEQAMDLVKSHLRYAVREEVEVLKLRIQDLETKVDSLEKENKILREYAPPEVLTQLNTSGGGGGLQQQQQAAPQQQQPAPPIVAPTAVHAQQQQQPQQGMVPSTPAAPVVGQQQQQSTQISTQQQQQPSSQQQQQGQPQHQATPVIATTQQPQQQAATLQQQPMALQSQLAPQAIQVILHPFTREI